jgi:flagellar hook protein FlgE
MFFDIGLSGLNAAAADLKVIGNNISNSNTNGFKQSKINFQNMVTNTRNSGTDGVVQGGSGTDANDIQQQFTQGTITSTTNPTDLAINGNGFFQLNDPKSSATSYSRNGAFRQDSLGFLVNSTGQQLVGYAATNGVITGAVPTPINLSNTARIATPTTSVSMQVNLNAGADVPANAFDPADATSYNFTSPVTVYDNQGVTQNMSMYFVKAAADSWNVYSTTAPATNAATTTTTAPQNLGTIAFNADGSLAAGSGTFTNVVTDAAGDTATLDLTGSTQSGTLSYAVRTTQNGYTSGSLNSFSFDTAGNIVGNYSNGEPNVLLGQVTLANFTAPTGLRDLGNNAWASTAASGLATIGVAGTGSYGPIQGSALEGSNVDQQVQLVALLAAQRTYQANAQTIQVMNQIAQTTISMGG